jgi:DNA-binding cell septation regulator SpoVG
MLKIRVVSVSPGGKSHILASCNVELTSEDGREVVTICDARVLRNRSGELWVGYPAQPTPDLDGIRYISTIEFSRQLKRRITDAVLQEYAHISGSSRGVKEFSNVR